MAPADKITLKVEGMTCNHCKANVEKALKTLDGVEQAEVDLKNAQVDVLINPNQASKEALKEAVETAGYKVLG